MVTVDQALDITNALRDSHLALQPEFCTHVRNRAASCTACMDACPHDALLVEGNEIATDPDNCTGCGACVAACPTAALANTTPTRAALYAETERIARRSSKLAFCCSQAGLHSIDDDRFIDMACLAQLDEALLAHAALNGAPSLALIHGTCESCINAKVESNIEQTIQDFRGLCKFWGIEAHLTRTVLTKEEHPGADPSQRRQVFKEILEETKDAAIGITAKTFLKEEEPPATLAQTLSQSMGSLKKKVPARTMILANDLFEIEPRPKGPWPTRQFAQVHIDANRCEHCGKCSFFCPTGALSQIGDAPRKAVMGVTYQANEEAFHEFRPSECVRCGLCVDSCPSQALSLDDAEAEKLFEIAPQKLP